MTSLLVIIVLVLLAVALWQLTKIFDLTRFWSDSSQVASDNDNNVQGYLMFGFFSLIYILQYMVGLFTGTSCSSYSCVTRSSRTDNLMNIRY
jgi:cytochrome c oxidase subunit 2